MRVKQLRPGAHRAGAPRRFMLASSTTTPRLRLPVAFDAPQCTPGSAAEGVAARIAVPRLGGAPAECIFPNARAAGTREGFVLWESDGLLIGCGTETVGASLQNATQRLYVRLLRARGDRSLYRIWNYVPGINAHVGGVENYQAFCAGRSLAFEGALGGDFKRLLPAASAVGCRGEELAALFVAGDSVPRHVENPEQVPAYEYPEEHGPRPPSFARASCGRTSSGRRVVFISGTAAIKGHATVAAGQLEAQLACTLDNLRVIARAAGLGDDLGAGGSAVERHFKVYLREPADLEFVRRQLESALLRPADRVLYLAADVCRAALAVEIEATIVGG